MQHDRLDSTPVTDYVVQSLEVRTSRPLHMLQGHSHLQGTHAHAHIHRERLSYPTKRRH